MYWILYDVKGYFKQAYTQAFLFAAITLFIQMGITYIRHRTKPSGKEVLLLVVDAMYLYFAYYITIGMRVIGSRREVELIPFYQIQPFEWRLVFENLLLFVPYGILCPLTMQLYGKRCNFKKILLLGMDASIVIEVLQYALNCGKSETTDIVMNVAGAIIGYGIYRIGKEHT